MEQKKRLNMQGYSTITENTGIKEQLEALAEKHKGRIAFSTSFGIEDQVITDVIFKNNIQIEVFTLDTGRLFPETYKVWGKTYEKYQKKIKVYYPKTDSVENLLSEKGPYSFYNSVENRKECCHIRKVVPLKRSLEGIDLWITGLRAEQSQAREDLQFFEKDDSFALVKFNPLKNWTYDQAKEYLLKNDVPYNSLHNKGFVSIGCEPCTRAVKDGENFRDGRWWWENKSAKECGLHESRVSKEIISTLKINNN